MYMKFILDGTAEKMMHPARFLILRELELSDKPLYVEQLAVKTKIHHRMVSHHLDVLESEKLVSCKYLIKEDSKRGVAVRMCEATPKAREVMRNIKESMSFE